MQEGGGRSTGGVQEGGSTAGSTGGGEGGGVGGGCGVQYGGRDHVREGLVVRVLQCYSSFMYDESFIATCTRHEWIERHHAELEHHYEDLTAGTILPRISLLAESCLVLLQMPRSW